MSYPLAERPGPWTPREDSLPAWVYEALADGQVHQVDDLAERFGVDHVAINNATLSARRRGQVRATVERTGSVRKIVGLRRVAT